MRIGTPSSNTGTERIERLPPSTTRAIQTPQTPGRTPRSISKLNLSNVESVDLTGDDDEDVEQVSSPSSAEMFGMSQVIWTEEAASRPEPQPSSQSRPKGGRKRKSNEISTGSAGQGGNHCRRAGSPRRVGREDSVGFVDIDDMVVSHSQSQRQRTESFRDRLTRSATESTDKNVFDDIGVTETSSQVKTRHRSVADETPSLPKIISPAVTSSIGSQPKSAPTPSPRPLSTIQVTATPAKTSPEGSTQSPNRIQKPGQGRIIQDSEDEEDVILAERPCKLPLQSPARDSPKVIESSATSSTWKDIPKVEVSGGKTITGKGTRSRVGSPLKPISRNASTKQDSAPSPLQRDSPTKISIAIKSTQISARQTPSPISAQDRKLAVLFLKSNLTLASYYMRVRNLISQNAIAAVAYADAGEVAPPELKEERIRLLTMEKSYIALESLREQHKAMVAKKVIHTSKVLELLDIGADYSVHEEQSSLLTQEILTIERETAQHLHASGAIKDGFGTGSEVEQIISITPAVPSKHNDVPNSTFQGSSAIGNAQVIFQTQISSMGQNLASTSSQSGRGRPTQLPKSTAVSEPGSSLKFSGAISPSPLKKTASREEAEHYSTLNGEVDWHRSQPSMRQPNFYRDPMPANYNLDGGEVNLEDLLQDEQEILDDAQTAKVAQNFDDDYGAYDDDDDMVEFAQEVEQRHSFDSTGFGSKPRKAQPQMSASIPDPETRRQTPSSVGKTMYSHVEQETAAAKKMPWYKDVKKVLRERFKLTGFRHHQLDAINATLDGKDAFVLMPTGGGKSLCYQLPAVIQTGRTKGVTVVISPLLSLMSDQVDHLRKLNIRAATLNSDMKAADKREIMDHLRESYPEQFIELLYVTPEMINNSDTIQNVLRQLHKNKKLARIVIDEAHCVSQWGHDFRPDYVALGKVRKLFPNVPYMALTATATENVKVDVMHNLGMEGATVYSQSFNRPNLRYSVRSKKGKAKASEFLDDVVKLINSEYRNQTGIIYTLSRKNCEQLAEMLQTQYGISAHHFHANMQVEEKQRVQRQWQNGTIKVVVATIAFGMGIDKPDVRFVIHHTIPKSLEGYYQETGRAGRDGKISGCYLYYGYPDTKILKDFIYKSEGTEEQKERQRKMLQRIVQYCENRTDCRRVQVLHYFGESYSKEECGGTCDNCKSDAVFKTMDFTPQAQAALKIVHNVQSSHVTLLHCVDILRGVTNAKVRKLEHDTIQGFGAASSISRGEIERIFYRLLMENALAEHNVINRAGFATQYLNVRYKPLFLTHKVQMLTLQLGPNCRDFITGHRKLKLQVKVSASPAAAPKQYQPYPSTIVTSPIAEPRKRRARANRDQSDEDVDYPYGAPDDFVAPESEEEEYFELLQSKGKEREATPAGLGPPVTTDERMEALPELHRVFVYQFVEEAKKEVDRIKNDRNLARLFFTESNLREMAISWTVNIADMRQISGINIDAVNKWGKYIIPIVARYSKNYDDAMNGREDRDIDENHQNVIDLCSDDDEEEYGLGDSEEEAIFQAEQQGSKYFQTGQASSSSHSHRAPRRTQSRGSSAGPRQNTRGNSFQYRHRSRKGAARKSGGSTSGQSTFGVTKRKPPAGAKKTGGSTASKSSGLFKQFGNHENSNGRSGGRTGGGIGMMPT